MQNLGIQGVDLGNWEDKGCVCGSWIGNHNSEILCTRSSVRVHVVAVGTTGGALTGQVHKDLLPSTVRGRPRALICHRKYLMEN